MTMREKMAQAMRHEWELHYGRMACAHWDSGVGTLLANAALKAQLEPTDGMVDAGMGLGNLCDGEIYATWQAMVNAARADK